MTNVRNYSLLIIFIVLLLTGCKTAKSGKTTNVTEAAKKVKKNPQAVETNRKIGNMLDSLAKDLVVVLNDKVEVVRTAEGVDIIFDPGVTFESSLDQLTPNSKEQLDRITDILVKYPYTLVAVEGHADSSGNQQKNKILSVNRAVNVAKYIKSRGVIAERLTAQGFGASQPIVSNATIEGRKRNRRVVVKIKADEKKIIEQTPKKG